MTDKRTAPVNEAPFSLYLYVVGSLTYFDIMKYNLQKNARGNKNTDFLPVKEAGNMSALHAGQ